MGGEQVPPAPIAHFNRRTGGVDDIREQDRREHTVGLGAMPHTGEELLDLVEDRVGITDKGDVIDPRQFDVLRARDSLGHVSAVLDGKLRSPALWMIRVGTRIAGNTWRTSMSAIMLQTARPALG